MKRIRLLLLCLLVYSGLSGWAQTHYFRHYQVENGLSHNTVYCSLQEKKGFLWFGTKDGLNRFDGYTFKIFRHNSKDSSSIGSNIVLALFEQSPGIILVGTDRGLYIYNSSTELFTTFKNFQDVKINQIDRDRNGIYWLLCNGILYSYDWNTGRFKAYPDKSGILANSFCFTPSGDIWVGASNGYLQKLNKLKGSFSGTDVFSHSPWVVSHDIETLYSDSDGVIFVGTSFQGFKNFNTQKCTYRDVLTYNKDHTTIYVRKFLRSKPGEYWLATESGIFIYNTAKPGFTNLKKRYNDPYSITDNAVYTLYKDVEGGIWAGTYFGGLNYYPRQYSLFTKYYPGEAVNQLKGNIVREIHKDRLGNLWLGTEDNGLNKLNIKTNTWTHYLPGSRQDISSTNIHGIFPYKNELFIGTFRHGLDVMDIPTGKVTRHYFPDNKSSSLNSNFILNISKIHTGELLFASDNGLYRYNLSRQNFTFVDMIPRSYFIHSLLEDHSGHIWLGTWNHGIYRAGDSKSRGLKLEINHQNFNQLSRTMINGIFEDKTFNLWFCTDGIGLWKYNPLERSCKVYDLNNKLPSNYIYKTLEDENGNLWISTSKGLVCMNIQHETTTVYTKANGLLSEQFNYSSAFKDTDGTLFFGSVKGMISFNPASFTTNNFIAPVYLTGIQTGNKDVQIGAGDSILSRSIIDTRSIELPYNRSTFNIDFAALSYSSPAMTQYQYKLQGFDKNWTLLMINRRVYFTGLAPGRYTFRVKSSNNGIWTNAETDLQIRIYPPWWVSSWAFLLYSCLLILISLTLLNNYHKNIRAKNKRIIELLENEQEKQLYHAKIEFFTHLAHEIRTPLTLIRGPMEKILKKADQVPEIRNNLLIMEKNTNRLLDLTNQLLDFKKTETCEFSLSFVKTTINTLLEDICSSFQLLTETTALQFSLILPEVMLVAWVDPEVFQKIVSNLLSNAVKYSKSIVRIELILYASSESLFSVKIMNDGYLIPAELREKVFEPFFRIRETEKQLGTGIGLPLARSMAELHNGMLVLLNPADKFNTFLLTLPIHQEKEFNLYQTETAGRTKEPAPVNIASYETGNINS